MIAAFCFFAAMDSDTHHCADSQLMVETIESMRSELMRSKMSKRKVMNSMAAFEKAIKAMRLEEEVARQDVQLMNVDEGDLMKVYEGAARRQVMQVEEKDVEMEEVENPQDADGTLMRLLGI